MVTPSMVWPLVSIQVFVASPGILAEVSLKRQSRLPEPPWLPSVNQSRSKFWPPAAATPVPTERSTEYLAATEPSWQVLWLCISPATYGLPVGVVGLSAAAVCV